MTWLEPNITFDNMLERRKDHLIPTAVVSWYRKDWYRISQINDVVTRSINEVAIQIERIAHQIRTAMNEQIKLKDF